ncbi:MAG: DUF2304 domain-containing protein [Candidatus Sungbacteria bacterium]|nr:DUF2304 domain-containing protein [Candidatus Sungbacteria bacterium]
MGFAVALTALYMTRLYYKRAVFGKKEFFLWVVIWAVFVLIVLFPHSIKPLADYLGLVRPLDLIMIAAFIFLFFIAFYTYAALRRQERQIEKLVRDAALKGVQKTS